MLIISKAMKLTGLKGLEDEQSAEASLSRFTDGDTVSNWAVAGVADTIASGVTSGRTKEQLAPKANISRAEVAIIIQRLLQYSKLIDQLLVHIRRERCLSSVLELGHLFLKRVKLRS